jgi:hypothetical protein
VRIAKILNSSWKTKHLVDSGRFPVLEVLVVEMRQYDNDFGDQQGENLSCVDFSVPDIVDDPNDEGARCRNMADGYFE